MKYFENRVKEYIEYYEQIRRDTVNSTECRISSDEIDEIDEIYSLYILYKNNLLGGLKEEFDNKIERLNTKLTKDQLFTVLKNLDI